MKLTYGQIDSRVGLTVVSQELEDHARWSLRYRMVVQLNEDHTFWAGPYEEPTTENQEWPDDSTEEEFVQVYPHEVTTTVYTTEP